MKKKAITKHYTKEFVLRLEAREDIKLQQISDFWGNIGITESVRRLIRDKKIN